LLIEDVNNEIVGVCSFKTKKYICSFANSELFACYGLKAEGIFDKKHKFILINVAE